MTKHKEFDIKGVRVAVYPMRDVEAVSVYASFDAGAWYEGFDGWGAFHLLEHLTVSATKKFQSRFKLEEYKEIHAVETNAWTSQSSLGYWLEFSNSKLPEAMELLTQYMFESAYKSNDLKRELGVINQEYTDRWSDPYQRFWQARQNQYCGVGHPYSRNAIGEPKYFNTLNLPALRNLQKNYLVNKNLNIAVAGKVSADEINETLQKFLPDLKKSKAKINIPAVEPQEKYLWHKEDVDQVLLHVAWPLPGRDYLSLSNQLKLSIASYLLGGSGRSMLYRKLRHEKGLVYGVHSGISLNPTHGIFYISTSTDQVNAKKVLTMIKQVLDEFKELKISDKQYKQATSYLNMRAFLSYDSVDSIAGKMSDQLHRYGRIISPEEIVSVTNQITKRQVKNIFEKYVEPNPEFISVMAKKDPELG